MEHMCLGLLGVSGVPEQLAGIYTKIQRGRMMQGGGRGRGAVLLLFSGNRREGSLNQPDLCEAWGKSDIRSGRITKPGPAGSSIPHPVLCLSPWLRTE